ncbi:amidase [Herbiconiux sp. YIM B11900]|uniref:amidase n=1 Tax=Herbiconiux sp. YIM B11900 TaxID=3404131 RepID=UPI003F8420F7
MNQEDIVWLSASEIASHVAAHTLRPSEIAEAFVQRIAAVNPGVNAYIYHDPDAVLAEAKQLDAKIAAGEALGPLAGVPYAVKGATSMKDLPLDAGLPALQGNLGTYDAVVVKRMREAGGLFLGRTNIPEATYASFSDNPIYGATHNPWKQGHSAGGSSGGAAAAVAAGMAPIAEGADGGGSIRIPASLCGAFGFKPTGGRVPQSLLPGRFNTWVSHGPITRTVRDAALWLNATVGPDSEDPTSLPHDGTDYLREIEKPLTGVRIAWSPDLGLGYIDPEVAAVCLDALQAFVELGAEVEEAKPEWPNPEEAFWTGVFAAGFASEHDLIDWERYRGQLDDNLLALISDAKKATGEQLGSADAFRGRMWDSWAAFTSRYDLLLTPTLASAAFKHKQIVPEWFTEKSAQRQVFGWLLTYPFNMLTTPASTVPAGFTADGRPIGLQIAGGHLADALVMRASARFESVRPWAQYRPEEWWTHTDAGQ